jgi:RNA polymerase sigma-70 factor (ECF subfamily)
MNEQEIIRRVISGDNDAYGQLIERYQPGLIRYCYTIVHDPDGAEDIAQEAFIRAYDKLNHYDPDFRFSTWLYKIAHNLALKSLRRRPDLQFDEDAGFTAYDHEQDVSDREDKEEAIRQAVAGLSVNYQSVIFLHYWERRDYTEIADIMGVPTTTIKNWLYRARQELKGK